MSEQSNSEGTTKRLVRATVASVASGLVAYGIRKAAPAIRQKLQAIGDGSVPGTETLGKAKDAVAEKVEVATAAVTDRIGSGSPTSTRSGRGSTLSDKEREERQRRRAQHRRERKKALTS